MGSCELIKINDLVKVYELMKVCELIEVYNLINLCSLIRLYKLIKIKFKNNKNSNKKTLLLTVELIINLNSPNF